VAGLVFREEAVQREIARQLEGFIGARSTEMVQTMMTARQQAGGGAAMVLSVVGQWQDALNTIWKVKAVSFPGHGLGIGFLLLVSMILTTLLSAFAGKLGSVLSVSELLAHV
jgi:membrane protein